MSTSDRIIDIKEYTYDLPEEKIALFPLAQRDESKLLVYNAGRIDHRHFHNLPDLLPGNSFLFFNDTRVIPARLHFKKDTGATIEIFLLTPHAPADIPTAMQATGHCSWKCTIGNLKRWKKDSQLVKQLGAISLNAVLRDPVEGVVEFSWSPVRSFASVIELAGETPLPPYLHRKAEKEDRARYQTIYSHHDGAVAAPTAGLHFTESVLAALKGKGIQYDFLTLHVSAGTFQPVKVNDASKHVMHSEKIVVQRTTVSALLQPDKFIVPVGTTSMRTLESLYWLGAKLLKNPDAEFIIRQEDADELGKNAPATADALHAVLSYMDRKETDTVAGRSAIYILPGYTFRLCDALITNFHQPGSTLMLLVAAFTGNDWRSIYQEALTNNYRFLSYGDSSLLIPKRGTRYE